MGHNSLWQVGLSYLDHCPAAGNETIEFLLLRLPLRTEAKSLKIIREAQKRQMHHVGVFRKVKNNCEFVAFF